MALTKFAKYAFENIMNIKQKIQKKFVIRIIFSQLKQEKILKNLERVKKYDYTLDDGVDAFLFGGKFSLGYGGVTLFIKKDFTPIFNDKANLPNKNGIQFGIEIANIDF